VFRSRRRVFQVVFLLLFTPVLILSQSKPFGDGLSTPHIAPDRTFDAQHYLLELNLDYENKEVAGQVTITLQPLTDDLDHIVLDSAELDVHGAEVNGRPAKFSVQPGKLLIDLDRPYKAAEHLSVKVAYSGHPRRGLYWVGPDAAYPQKPAQIWSQGEDEDSHYWFPCYDFPNDKATSETVTTVKKPFIVISNGRLIDVHDNGATRTFHWKMDQPHSSFLTSVAAGDFEEYTDSASGVSLEYYVPRGTGRERALRSFGHTPDILQYFSQRIGIPYPYNKYAQVAVADFPFGGMENITASTETANTLHDARAEQDYPSDSVVAHELAHQWWGDLVTPADWSHIWLSEGFASYFETLYTQKSRGEDEFRYELLRKAESYFQEDAAEYRRPIVSSLYTDPVDVFDQHTYDKGSLVLHMIRYLLGDDAFFNALSEYGKRFANDNVVTDDLRRSIYQTTGKNLETFFNQWLYHAGYPGYEVEWLWTDGNAKVTVRQQQMVDSLTPLFDLPIVIDFTMPDGRVQAFTVRINQADQEFAFPLPERPAMVRFDPGNNILKKLNFRKDPDELRYQALKDSDVIGRIRAIEALGRRPDDEKTTETLVDVLLHDSFGGARAAAVNAVGRFRGERTLTALLAATDDRDPRVRRAAVTALANFRNNEEATAAILKIFESDSSYATQAGAASALSRSGYPRAFEILSAALTAKTSHEDVIRRAVLPALLGTARTERLRPILFAWTAYGKDEHTRPVAISLLPTVSEGDHQEVVRRLIELLHDPWIYARESAIGALGEMQAREALTELQVSAVRETDGRLRKDAREAIERILSRQ
jgi:aminopeptidase N